MRRSTLFDFLSGLLDKPFINEDYLTDKGYNISNVRDNTSRAATKCSHNLTRMKDYQFNPIDNTDGLVPSRPEIPNCCVNRQSIRSHKPCSVTARLSHACAVPVWTRRLLPRGKSSKTGTGLDESSACSNSFMISLWHSANLSPDSQSLASFEIASI